MNILAMQDQQRMAEVTFLALVIWREARGESDECITAVAFSILNRVDNPAWWGKDLLEVLFKKWQYSSMTNPKDKQLTTWPRKYEPSWVRCLDIACKVIDHDVKNTVNGADSYHDTSVKPKWATPDKFVKQIDHILFYNTDFDHEANNV